MSPVEWVVWWNGFGWGAGISGGGVALAMLWVVWPRKKKPEGP